MKKYLSFLVLPFLTACSTVPAGHVGVKVYLLGGSKGVDHEVLGVGRYWIGMNEQLYLFPTFQQNYVWSKSQHEGKGVDESISFQTREGMSINIDLGISYSLNPDKVATVFQKYRKGIDEITDIFLRNMIRDAINEIGSGYSVEEAYAIKKTELMMAVEKKVREEVAPIGILIDRIYIVGSMRLPEAVLQALNSKIEATQTAQKIQNEVMQAKAQAEKAVAIAKGEAEANRIKQLSITDTLIRYESVQKWDGHLPLYSGSGVPLINLGELHK